jgi:hypothetical protein
VKANEQGEFWLFLLPGKWSLRAWASYTPDYFVSDSKKAKLVNDKPTELEFWLKPAQKLLVQVVDENGKPIPNARLWITAFKHDPSITPEGVCPRTWLAFPIWDCP